MSGENDLSHLQKARRISEGSLIEVYDAAGSLWQAKCLETVPAQFIELRAEERLRVVSEAKIRLSLYQALPQGSKFDLVLELAGSYGAANVVPIITEKSLFKMPNRDISGKYSRWQKILEAQSKQTGRATVTELLPICDLANLAKAELDHDLMIFGHFSPEAASLRNYLAEHKERINESASLSMGLFVGPESGFTQAEAELLKKLGATEVSFGPRVLRSELAASFVLASLTYLELI
ncbi:MAG: RsmE family RNA methyltransferase [Eubacteriales bacterium]|nr:RsmE family RNA methyltransferase [Eubacteriales bacterium]